MERASRSELLKTIETQKEQIQRYETRLRDVVRAYKGVVKEKEALESSMKVLSLAQSRPKGLSVETGTRGPPSDTASDRGRESDLESEEGSISSRDVTDPLNASQSAGNESDTAETAEDSASLETKIHTLSSSLLTLTEEKSKLEASFIADKKRMKLENEELQKSCESLKEKMVTQGRELESQLQEMKSKIRSQQIERETEQTDHVVMLRELQKLLAQEREKKEQLENQLDEVEFTQKEKEHQALETVAACNRQTDGLKREIKALQQTLKDVEEKNKKPSPMLLGLQKEAQELKSDSEKAVSRQFQHQLQVQQEESRVRDAAKQAQVVNQQSESRISELESKLSELSETLGNYERLRFQDQQNIHKLKERVNQLDIENTALAQSTEARPDEDEDSLEHLDPAIISSKILKLKDQLKMANVRAVNPVSIEDLLLEAGVAEENPLCRKYREELDQVKDEFERYKLRAQSVLKNKKESSSTKEVDILKEHVNDLREKLKSLHLQQDEELERFKLREDNLRKTLISLQDKHKHAITQLHGEHNTQLQDMEDEMKKQRERTISMLAEKDRELETLRATSTQRLETDYVMRFRPNHDMVGGASSERGSSEEEAMARLLSSPPSGQGEMTLLYFAQEQARKDVEISSLRKQKRELELGLRELQLSSSLKQENLHDEIDSLKEEIRRLERSITREGANLEYLKNVTYKFLICHDTHGKQQMLNAITTILQFSPQEKSSVQTQTKGWWGSS